MSQKGLIEYPRTLGQRTYIDIYIKMDDEKEITLAHEMMHLKQVLIDGKIDENEAYIYEKHLNIYINHIICSTTIVKINNFI